MSGIITNKEFARLCKGGTLSGGYLFYGEEEYLKLRALESARRALFGGEDDPFNHVKLSDVEGDILDALEEQVSSLPMFAEKKLTEVHGVNYQRLPPESVERLASLLAEAGKSDDTVVILCTNPGEFDGGRSPQKPSALLKKLSAVCTAVSFPYETPMGLNSWVCRHFSASGIACTPANAARIINFCSRDMFTLSGEIEKLVCFTLAKGETALDPEDIERVCCGRSIEGAFDFTDALLKGRSDDACRLLSGMKDRREKPEVILGGVADTLSGMYTVKTLQAAGMNSAEIAAKTGIHEYRVKNFLAASAGKSRARLQKALELCLEADREVKFSKVGSYVVLDRLVMRLCRM